MTTAKLPPPTSAASTTSMLPASTAMTNSAPLDPYILLDRLDHHRVTVSAAASSSIGGASGTTTTTTTTTTFDPIDFLNQHYRTEAVLSAQLPRLRVAVTNRIETLEDNIANALQRQSETAATTRQHIRDSVASAAALERRVLLVRDKAAASEKTVSEITQELKRLDSAKRHLQRSITTLKRLHMLVHAVEELRLTAAQEQQQQHQQHQQHHSFPDYATAAHLVEATRLLLSHFEAHQARVEPMRRLSNKVDFLTEHMRLTLVRGFRIVAFGQAKAELLEATSSSRKNKKQPKTIATAAAAAAAITASSRGAAEDHDHGGQITNPSASASPPPPRMTPAVMQGGVLFIDALGPSVRAQFIHDFCSDHLGDYLQEFQPPSIHDKNKQQPEKRVSSFKIVEKPPEPEPSAASLDAVEKRFIWFRHVLQVAFDDNFPRVFPPAWNVQAQMARHFLQLTRDHILALLEDNGPRRDADATNAKVLLKALRKTLVFEKEITAWLQRECGTVFKSSSSDDGGKNDESKSNVNNNNNNNNNNVNSRAMTPTTNNTGGGGSGSSSGGGGSVETTVVAVDPLMGVASSAFNDYMGPYIALEEQSMDEQLVEALEDRTVDNRGDRPVFISSTNLFVYIKGSITRCTVLSNGKAFFLLYQAFQDSLRKYSQILNGKLPASLTVSAPSSIVGLGASPKLDQATTHNYRIPKGEEVTVCHVINTCEYCIDTVEALEDLIRDTINDTYAGKIDMMSAQEAFHDITAKSIRVLVSGLMNRNEAALRTLGTTNWAMWDSVGEESPYVYAMHEEIEPYVTTVRALLPTSYFRSFCDRFSTAFMEAYYDTLIRLKRISEPGTQQLLLDVYNLKTLFLKLPVLEEAVVLKAGQKKPTGGGSTIAPAMYTKLVQKQFGRIETLLKLVGTPLDLLIDNFRVQWVGGSALDLQAVLSLQGLKRPEQVKMLEQFGVDPATALKGATYGVSSATIVSERVQNLQDQGSNVAAKVSSDLNQIGQKVNAFRNTFRG